MRQMSLPKKNINQYRLERRRLRVRKKITGTPECPRLRVRRSLKHIYVQLIDDTNSRTLASASSIELKLQGGGVEAAKSVGQEIARKAKEGAIEEVRFDRGGLLFHGRVKALADGAREAGLQF